MQERCANASGLIVSVSHQMTPSKCLLLISSEVKVSLVRLTRSSDINLLNQSKIICNFSRLCDTSNTPESNPNPVCVCSWPSVELYTLPNKNSETPADPHSPACRRKHGWTSFTMPNYRRLLLRWGLIQACASPLGIAMGWPMPHTEIPLDILLKIQQDYQIHTEHTQCIRTIKFAYRVDLTKDQMCLVSNWSCIEQLKSKQNKSWRFTDCFWKKTMGAFHSTCRNDHNTHQHRTHKYQ